VSYVLGLRYYGRIPAPAAPSVREGESGYGREYVEIEGGARRSEVYVRRELAKAFPLRISFKGI